MTYGDLVHVPRVNTFQDRDHTLEQAIIIITTNCVIIIIYSARTVEKAGIMVPHCRGTVSPLPDNLGYFQVLCCIRRLNNEALNVAESILLNPPKQGKYQILKEALLARFTISQKKNFTKAGLQLGDL